MSVHCIKYYDILGKNLDNVWILLYTEIMVYIPQTARDDYCIHLVYHYCQLIPNNTKGPVGFGVRKSGRPQYLFLFV